MDTKRNGRLEQADKSERDKRNQELTQEAADCLKGHWASFRISMAVCLNCPESV